MTVSSGAEILEICFKLRRLIECAAAIGHAALVEAVERVKAFEFERMLLAVSQSASELQTASEKKAA
jgi:hypothetical protein